MRLKLLTVAMLPALLAGCTGASPTFTPGSAPQAHNASPGPVASALEAQRGGATGDLRIALGGECLLRKDSQNGLRLAVPLAASWLGTQSFPATAYTLTLEGAGTAVSGAVTSAEPLTAWIGLGSGNLNRMITLTAKIDPKDAVKEFSEANNGAIVKVTMPATAPADTGDHVVPCA
jgi:hypothetical protein